MSSLPPQSDTALAPVREALRAAAQTQSAELHDGARREVDALLASARAQAQKIIADAARDGAAAARAEAALRSSRIRREAHELVLARRSSVLAELRRQLRVRASALQDDPSYPAFVAGLREQCVDLLGPAATVSASPDGGVIAAAGLRSLDLSLPVLAELALDSLPEARELWTR
ncbi:hypothetical protein AOC05_05850 [Arthrobacter alpinus]|uniref:ATP synthase subunit E n=1 Tax=Arthrobacter alpinus TaxID=656366 RepID=A0A0M3UG15_9MICC|nr:hypothetical protein [Arthrobacter alpinus]ALE91969.1 hypothetical protein AOC05_05850 [Arthrobacter alpinus]